MDGGNLQCMEPVIVASISYPGIERHEPFFLLPGFPLRSLRLCGENVLNR